MTSKTRTTRTHVKDLFICWGGADLNSVIIAFVSTKYSDERRVDMAFDLWRFYKEAKGLDFKTSTVARYTEYAKYGFDYLTHINGAPTLEYVLSPAITWDGIGRR